MKLYSAISFNFLVVGRFRHLSITLFNSYDVTIVDLSLDEDLAILVGRSLRLF